jgi:hypothetical protein
MARSGNDLWWDQVLLMKDELGDPKAHYKDVEIETFKRLYLRMKDDGMKQDEIRQHFKDTFNLGYTAFYTRLRKAGWYVL